MIHRVGAWLSSDQGRNEGPASLLAAGQPPHEVTDEGVVAGLRLPPGRVSTGLAPVPALSLSDDQGVVVIDILGIHTAVDAGTQLHALVHLEKQAGRRVVLQEGLGQRPQHHKH